MPLLTSRLLLGLAAFAASLSLAAAPDAARWLSLAAATALAFFGIAGKKAGVMAGGPGTFMIQLLDALYTLTPEDVQQRCLITVR